jgi:hypothetical protein
VGRGPGSSAHPLAIIVTSRPVLERHGFVIMGERYFGEGDRAAKTYVMRCVLDGTTPLRSWGVISVAEDTRFELVAEDTRFELVRA